MKLPRGFLEGLDRLQERLQGLPVPGSAGPKEPLQPDWIIGAIEQRSRAIARSVVQTVKGSRSEVEAVVRVFSGWMVQRAVVRILGAGRARLAAAIPANRLMHGGARVYVQDDILPMPHAFVGGGILAASASGKTESLLENMATIRTNAPHITVVGIAKADATPFRNLCHHFIGIQEDKDCPNPLSALADMGEYVISEVLDAMVVAAGKLAGFDDRKWRLGHENIGATGPYDARTQARLAFTELD